MKKMQVVTGIRSYVVGFLLGGLSVLYIWPPSPQIEMSNMDMEKVTWQVINQLEDNGYSITEAKKAITKPSTGWWE